MTGRVDGRLALAILAVFALSFWFSTQRQYLDDDDTSLMLLNTLGNMDAPAIENLSQQARDCVAAAGYAPDALRRLDRRLNHRSNYPMHSAAIAAVRAVSAEPEETSAGTSLSRVTNLGMFAAQMMVGLCVVLLLWRLRLQRSLLVLAILTAVWGTGNALWQLSEYVTAWRRASAGEGPVLAAMAARALELGLRQFIVSFLGFAASSSVCLLAILAYGLGRSDHVRASYAVALASGLVHASMGYLLLICLCVIDLLRAPSRLRDPVTIALILGGGAAFGAWDQAWMFLGTAGPLLSMLPPLALVLAARAEAVTDRLPGIGALRRKAVAEGTVIAAAAMLLGAWLTITALKHVLHGGLLETLLLAYSRGSRMLIALLLAALIDLWLDDGDPRPRLRLSLLALAISTPAAHTLPMAVMLLLALLLLDALRRKLTGASRSTQGFALMALGVAALSFGVTSLATRPQGASVTLHDASSLPPGQLQRWLSSKAIESVDRTVFHTIIADHQFNNSAVDRMCAQLAPGPAAPAP